MYQMYQFITCHSYVLAVLQVDKDQAELNKESSDDVFVKGIRSTLNKLTVTCRRIFTHPLSLKQVDTRQGRKIRYTA